MPARAWPVNSGSVRKNQQLHRDRQRLLRQLLHGVRRRYLTLQTLRQRQHHSQPRVLEPGVRRGWRNLASPAHCRRTTTPLSPGAGSVTIDGNTVVASQSERRRWRSPLPHGRPLRRVGREQHRRQQRLRARGWRRCYYDGATNVTLVNNTIVKNITTATSGSERAGLGSGPTAFKPASPAGQSVSGGNSALRRSQPSSSSAELVDPEAVEQHLRRQPGRQHRQSCRPRSTLTLQ